MMLPATPAHLMTKTEQAATMPQSRTSNARNMWGEKEQTNSEVLVVLGDDNELHHVVTVRWWMARRSDGMSPVHCSVWINGRESREAAGYGKASGFGYHKESAAFEAALGSAGVKLAFNVGGVGDSAVIEAMHAIANACGYENNHVRTVV